MLHPCQKQLRTCGAECEVFRLQIGGEREGERRREIKRGVCECLARVAAHLEVVDRRVLVRDRDDDVGEPVGEPGGTWNMR